MTTDDAGIGRQVRRFRLAGGMSQQQLADAAGLSQPFISKIESLKKPVTSRHTLLALAEALHVPSQELLGIPLPASTREDLVSLSAVAGIRAALDYPDEPVIWRPRRELVVLARTIMAARMACDYGLISAGLPALLAETRAAHDAGHRWAGPLLVRGLVAGSLTLRPIGWQDLAMRLAEAARRVATDTGHADDYAAAEFAYAQALLASGSRRRARSVAVQAADALPPTERVWAGMLHLHAGLCASSAGEQGGAASHFEQAETLAATPGDEVDPWLMEFTRDNVRTWRIAGALEANGTDPDRAVNLSLQVNRTHLVTRQRASRFDMDAGRAWYLAGKPERAVAFFLRAHEVAPQETRTRSSVREIVGQMQRDARGGGSAELRRLVQAMGVAA
ncbi:MAG TPA: helix-turn-helix transcriptional regulator [Candidatus Binatia bacterium]|nr:helix-turn-helix transcriptional regulator [Candidatus Binatia bacterium]